MLSNGFCFSNSLVLDVLNFFSALVWLWRWSSNGGIGGPVHSRKKGNIWKRHTTMLDEHLTQAPDQHKCFCGLRYRPRRQIGVNGFTSRVFSDKSSFHLSGNRLGNGFVSWSLQLHFIVHKHGPNCHVWVVPIPASSIRRPTRRVHMSIPFDWT